MKLENLTSRQIELLRLCKNGLNVLNLSPEDEASVTWMAKNCSLCAPSDGGFSPVYILTPNGEAYLFSIERAAEEKETERDRRDSERKEEHRHDWYIAIFTAISGLLAGMIIEYATGVLNAMLGLFRR